MPNQAPPSPSAPAQPGPPPPAATKSRGEARGKDQPDDGRRSRRRRKRWGRFALIAVPLLALGAGLYYWFHIRPYESTDDAFIEGNVIPIAPRISGQVSKLLVRDNQPVKQGDRLIEIDPRDFEARLTQAQASVSAAGARMEEAKAQVASDEAKVDQERASLMAAQSEAKRAQADLQRYQSLEGPAVSRSQLDLASAQARSGEATVEVARSRLKAATLQVTLSQAGIQSASAELQRNEALLRQAQLDLSYTKVLAPEDGFVTHRTVEAGAYVQAGQGLLALVPAHVWVVANFKETQLSRMRRGQPVQVHVDAYPHQTFRAHVDSIQRGSGARFSVLPPENASGNYVKVVQRVPVKILFDEPPDPELPLGPGLSVEPKVHVLVRGEGSGDGLAER